MLIDIFAGLVLYKAYYEFTATVTAFNTVPSQTDSTPCISANGQNICGRNDVLACPRSFKFGSRFIIDYGMGPKIYTCVDRTNIKFNNRFDISFDKDIKGAIAFGKQTLKIKYIKE
jgi:hypothetical protein